MLCILTQVLVIYFESNSGLVQGGLVFFEVDRLAFIHTHLTSATQMIVDVLWNC